MFIEPSVFVFIFAKFQVLEVSIQEENHLPDSCCSIQAILQLQNLYVRIQDAEKSQ